MVIREPFNAVSHLFGAVLAAVGTVVLLVLAWPTVPAVLSLLVFGLGAAFLYTSSSIYHWTKDPKLALQKMDHSAIFVMIAGSYTPVCVLALAGVLGWWVLGIQWGLAAVGVTATILMTKTPTWLRLVLYLVMGWMALPLMSTLAAGASWSAVWWMVAGGLFYTVGVFFYSYRKPMLWPGKFSSHEIWHLFVMGGTACHFGLMATMVKTLA